MLTLDLQGADNAAGRRRRRHTEPRNSFFADTAVRRVIYTSRSRVPVGTTVIDDIVQSASMRNAAAGITGVLWWGEQQFVQVLEGDADEIERTIKRIVGDPRHTDIAIVCDETARGRHGRSGRRPRASVAA